MTGIKSLPPHHFPEGSPSQLNDKRKIITKLGRGGGCGHGWCSITPDSSQSSLARQGEGSVSMFLAQKAQERPNPM